MQQSRLAPELQTPKPAIVLLISTTAQHAALAWKTTDQRSLQPCYHKSLHVSPIALRNAIT